jgi:flagellar P-ring protein precursor FlgI
VPVQLNHKSKLDILLNLPDFTTSTRVASKINERLGGVFAKSEGPSVVSLIVPDTFTDKVVDLISTVEMIEVTIDTPARVVINERTGTVVIGENVSISPVALAHGSLTIEIKASAPTAAAGAAAAPAAAQRTSLALVSGASIGELVTALNTMGVSPKDLIGILQAIKAAGSLKAELVVM